MPGKTPNLEFPYPEATDSDNVPKDIKALADRAETLLKGTSGQLLIVQSTGAPAAKAMKGDATLAADGTLTIGNGKVTRAKLSPASIQTQRKTAGVAGGSGTFTLTWPEEFADTNYTVGLSLSSLAPTNFSVRMTEKTKAKAVYVVTSDLSEGGEGFSVTLEAIAIHD